MYTAHFGLTEAPFSITPDPRYVYMSEGHREALAHLVYGIGEGGGFVQLTGEIGTGKTTLCRCLLEQLPPQVDAALILNPKLTDVELLAAVCDELGIAYPTGTTSRKLLVDALYRHLLDAHGRGRRTMLIIDEAQDLAPEVLEQIRLLTNLETPTQKLLQIILIGQPELVRLLAREDLRQLAQRVTARYHLLPFSEADTCAYIRHRLRIAGRKGRIFSDAAMRRVHRAARGVPRLINAICDRALLGAYTQDARGVNAATVDRAAREVLGRPVSASPVHPWQWVAAVVVIGGAWVLLTHGQFGLTSRGGAQTPADPPAAAGGPPPAATAPRGPLDGRAPALAPSEMVPAVPAGGAREVGPAASRPVSLRALLDDPTLQSDKRSALTNLYALWQVDVAGSTKGLGCDPGRSEGLRCLFKTGTWAKLRRLNLPAIIELTTPTWERRYAVVVAVDDQVATLDFGGRRHSFPLSEVDLYWDGPFIVLWKAPALASLSIAPGTRSKDVDWVRQRLGELDGVPPKGPSRDVFDDELRARVMAFQRSRSLVPDGIVGEETLIQLSTGPRDPNIPRLLRAGS